MEYIEYPELRQTYCFDCGACALNSILVYYGIDMREEEIMLMAGTTEDGTNIDGICKILSHFGLDYTAGKTSIEDIKSAIEQNFPVIITIQAYKSGSTPYSECWNDGHYVVVIGYDNHRIYFEDPAAYKRTWLAYRELEGRWHDVDKNGKLLNWGCIVKGIPNFKRGESVHMD